ncbi:MAG: tRNA threonylcarbamoyladenosine dehydratase [Treponema sp.]|nr:tRNA threonylcarbamoyladenosine dehydratase [Treponema sp.]
MAAYPFLQRLILLIGEEAATSLEKCKVLVVGLGGVGSWCAEALVRSGVGNISIVDSDTVCASNINRQAQAMCSTIGRLKTGALEERLKDISPGCTVKAFPKVFSKENADDFDIGGMDYVIDAIDTLPCKLDLIEAALAAGKPLYSSMGMAGKLDPALIKTGDIWDTQSCPLAKLVRQGLKKRDISGHFTAVYSTEKLKRNGLPEPAALSDHLQVARRGSPPVRENGRIINGSAVTVTAAAGMVLASLVLKDIYSRCAPSSPEESRG